MERRYRTLGENHVHVRLRSQPVSTHIPLVVRIRELNVEIAVQLDDEFGGLHHCQVLTNTSTRTSTELRIEEILLAMRHDVGLG